MQESLTFIEKQWSYSKLCTSEFGQMIMMMKTSTFNNHSQAAKHKIITIKLNWRMGIGAARENTTLICILRWQNFSLYSSFLKSYFKVWNDWTSKDWWSKLHIFLTSFQYFWLHYRHHGCSKRHQFTLCWRRGSLKRSARDHALTVCDEWKR